MRILALITIILGLASIVMGVVFICNANSGQTEIVNSIVPLKVDEVNPKFDAVSAKYNAVMAAEEPAIQGGTAAPSAMYNYLSSQRALLGLAKANIATVKAVRMNGMVDIMVGLGLAFAGLAMYVKKAA
jgi:hypothetical protein